MGGWVCGAWSGLVSEMDGVKHGWVGGWVDGWVGGAWSGLVSEDAQHA